MKKKTLALLVPVAIILLTDGFCLAVEYEIIDLGTIPDGGYTSYATSISENGNVTGLASTGVADYDNAFLWTPQDQMQDLGTLLGGDRSSGLGVNNDLQVVGWSDGPNWYSEWLPFLWEPPGPMQQLSMLVDDTAEAYGINNAGQIAGWSYNYPEYYETACRWDSDGSIQDLGRLATGPDANYYGSYGYAINETGNVVGESQLNTGNYPWHAFLWTPGEGMRDLGVPPNGGLWSKALDVNIHNHVAAWALVEIDSVQVWRAYIWTSANGWQPIGTLGGDRSLANGINDKDVVVGQAKTDSGEWHAFAWTQEGGIIDLNDYATGTDWTLERAEDINNKGQIVGFGINPDGLSRGFLLNPVCRGDFDDDCEVDLRDFAILAAAWRTDDDDPRWNPDCDISIPADDSIDIRDLKVFAENWLACAQ